MVCGNTARQHREAHHSGGDGGARIAPVAHLEMRVRAHYRESRIHGRVAASVYAKARRQREQSRQAVPGDPMRGGARCSSGPRPEVKGGHCR